jgi:hypothetical protein
VVLFEANTEYFAPWWAWPHILLAATGRVTYLANFHDPVRHKRFGPDWWHRLSLFLALRPLRGGLVHGAVPPGAQIPSWVRISEVPHGLFEETGAAPPAFDLRARLGIAPGAFLLLSFGLIGDRKNIDLLIDAVAQVPEAVLVVAGQDISATQRPASFYRDHARMRGVADRVYFVTGHIPEDEVSAYFHAADAVVLTYHRAFVSQSGVLQLAVVAGKPVLASSGPGPLRRSRASSACSWSPTAFRPSWMDCAVSSPGGRRRPGLSRPTATMPRGPTTSMASSHWSISCGGSKRGDRRTGRLILAQDHGLRMRRRLPIPASPHSQAG